MSGKAKHIIIATLALVTSVNSATAHDRTHRYNDWLIKQHNKLNMLCCDGEDVVYLGEDDWGTTRTYRVRVNGQWVDVPDSQLLRGDGGPNPTGNAVLWIGHDESGNSYIRCFAPGWGA